jgi:hypothetical protein
VEVARVIEGLTGVEWADVQARTVAVEGLPNVTLIANVIVKPGSAIAATGIRAHCRARLAPYKVPREVQIERTEGRYG